MHTFIENRRRHSQLESSFPPPKNLIILVHEPLDRLSEKNSLGDVDSTTISLLYLPLPQSNSASKHTSASFDNFLDTSSETTIRQPLHRKNNLLSNSNPSPSLLSANSCLVRHHAQSLSSDSLSLSLFTRNHSNF